jgi:plasmid stabilization system protein ParE
MFVFLRARKTDLDGIWLYIARESGSIEIASRVVDTITDRFWLLGQHPEIGRRRDIAAKFDPSGKQTNPTLGQVTSTRLPRVMQGSLRFTF